MNGATRRWAADVVWRTSAHAVHVRPLRGRVVELGGCAASVWLAQTATIQPETIRDDLERSGLTYTIDDIEQAIDMLITCGLVVE